MALFVILSVRIEEIKELVLFAGKVVLLITLIVVFCVLLRTRAVLRRFCPYLVLLLGFWEPWLVLWLLAEQGLLLLLLF